MSTEKWLICLGELNVLVTPPKNSLTRWLGRYRIFSILVAKPQIYLSVCLTMLSQLKKFALLYNLTLTESISLATRRKRQPHTRSNNPYSFLEFTLSSSRQLLRLLWLFYILSVSRAPLCFVVRRSFVFCWWASVFDKQVFARIFIPTFHYDIFCSASW